MRKFAFFLPQFHTIPENDEWWGKGFTEWTKVKNATPLYKGHVQPIHPQNENYYCLLNKETVVWQTSLMHEYGIDGMIYYHYYFKGRKLLEKPAENLLIWKDIDQPFFFCWANHDWNRSWQGTKEILLKQEYGNVDNWEDHFQYLLPFFRDSRYEKKNGKPLFMVFDSFEEKHDYYKYLDERCKEEGLKGIYLIESFNGGKTQACRKFLNNISDTTSSVFYREPSVSYNQYWLSGKHILRRMTRIFLRRVVKKDDILWNVKADDLYHFQISENKQNNIIHGIHLGFDNTPRHGKRGYVIEPPSKQALWDLLDEYVGEEYLFFNAWNEWAEGMVLEPTEEWGDRYLRWIKDWKKGC